MEEVEGLELSGVTVEEEVGRSCLEGGAVVTVLVPVPVPGPCKYIHYAVTICMYYV
jgi:hypothetical protein